MSSQVTLTLPEEILRQAEAWARHSGRPVADLLAETLELSLRPLGAPEAPEKPLAECSDEEVLAAADAGLGTEDDRRLSELLARQQAGQLADGEPTELLRLMQAYQAGLLRKARALREAVHRGLREPLEP